jgi:thioesterase domain-containing protein/acyl carrier protein
VGVMVGEVDLETANSNLSATIGANQVLLLDEHRQAVISGQLGELFVTGPNVTRGYLNDIERTSQVYLDINDKSTASKQARYYKTGDLAISHADGNVSIIGRNDQQIKIRGFRLDLNEIQHILLAHEQVAQANLQTAGEGENKQLIAFVVSVKGAQVEQKELLNYLSQQLPGYMVPTHVFEVLQFPLNKNGKVDRAQLLALAELQQKQVLVEPSNELEQTLLSIWQDVLKQNKICISADFFDIGGHSLAAIKVVANARKVLSIELPTDLLFKHKSIADIANYITTQNQAGSAALLDDERLICLNEKAKTSEMAKDEPCLVLMHAHGGHFNYHTKFIENIGEKQALFGLMPNISLLTDHGKPDIATVCDDYIEQLLPLKNQPISLIGWSLGAKQMMLMVERMQSLGFNLTGIALIDFDPAQQLTLEDSAAQLISDLHEYLIAEKLELSAELISALTKNLQGSYEEAMDTLLFDPNALKILGDDISTQALKQRFMMRWNIKHMLYDAPMPLVKLPLWLWYGTGHKSPASIWQQFCALPIKSSFIEADHYEILDQKILSFELVNNIEETTTLVTC